MKLKKIICAAVAATMALGATAAIATGCYSTNSKEDVKQVVATVNCNKSIVDDAQFGNGYSNVVGTSRILKRDLLASFMNVGSTYVNSYGFSYEQTFEMIVSGLVENAVVTQYATAYLIKCRLADEHDDFSLETYSSKATEKDKLIYLLGEEKAKKVKYEFYSSLNGTLDSYEKRILSEDNGYVGTGTRTTPAGIDELKEDYVPEKYEIYTGYKNHEKEDAGEDYEPLEGSTKSTRRRAYAQFIANLRRNFLINSDDKDTTDILSIAYIDSVYLARLREAVVDAYNDIFEDEQERIITSDENGVYTYVKNKYDGLDGEYTGQAKKYEKSSDFEGALSNIGDETFILYSPSTEDDTKQIEIDGTATHGTFGYVYNILLPFSSLQSIKLKELQGYRDADPQIITDSKYFQERNKLLKQITTVDQRSVWFNGETDYSFDASATDLEYYSGGKSYRTHLFFENNMTKGGENGKYEALDKYIGKYSYNGRVVENKNGSYTLVPEKLTIDGMLSEFSTYINYVLGTDNAVVTHAGDTLEGGTDADAFNAYYEVTDFTVENDDTEIDYSKLVYATGKVDFGATANLKDDNMFVKDGARYKVMSAVNELQYAYTTDVSVLSQYIGYSVSAYSTNYIKEFEYAAQTALRMGVGAFKVCAGDYGWHLIYVTDAFSTEGGEVYSPDWTVSGGRIFEEDTFEYKFYNWVKDKAIANEVSKKRTAILKDYNKEENVTINKDVYKDLI